MVFLKKIAFIPRKKGDFFTKIVPLFNRKTRSLLALSEREIRSSLATVTGESLF